MHMRCSKATRDHNKCLKSKVKLLTVNIFYEPVVHQGQALSGLCQSTAPSLSSLLPCATLLLKMIRHYFKSWCRCKEDNSNTLFVSGSCKTQGESPDQLKVLKPLAPEARGPHEHYQLHANKIDKREIQLKKSHTLT